MGWIHQQSCCIFVVDQDDFLLEFEDEDKPQHSVNCSPAPGGDEPALLVRGLRGLWWRPLPACSGAAALLSVPSLGSWLVRGGVWLIAALSLVSNALVVLSIFFSPAPSMMPAKLLIGLLALVNGLMGLWSGWLAAVDTWTFGSFWRDRARWETSFLCRLSGFLCMFTSQTGLFLLTLATVERYLTTIAASRHHKAKGHSGRSSLTPSVRLAIGLCFLLVLAITLPTLLAGHSRTSLCLPLPSSSSLSLVLSVSLVLIDLLCFVLMMLTYTRLYCRANKAPPTTEEEAALTHLVAWLLFSDCVLFLPVAFLCFSLSLRLPSAELEVAKGVLLLVVPLPACVNPLLYLLFNPLAREEVVLLVNGAVTVLRLGSGRGGARGPLSGTTDLKYDEEAEKQSCNSTQALGAIEGTKEDEEDKGSGRIKSETQLSVEFWIH
ncbi:leucine-rich repeat-containing G-protein coupled receptor 5-like [Aulostomus maculatus]